jgi:Holliday junction resolvase RusA-like endonuclease
MNETRKWRSKVANKCARLWMGKEKLTKAKVTFTRYSAVRPDFDNLAASFKAVQDGLIDGGVIENDTHAVIGNPAYEWVKASPRAGKITIKVEVST